MVEPDDVTRLGWSSCLTAQGHDEDEDEMYLPSYLNTQNHELRDEVLAISHTYN